MRLELDKPELKMGSQEELPFLEVEHYCGLGRVCPIGEQNRGQDRLSFILEVLKVLRNIPRLQDLIEGNVSQGMRNPGALRQ